jgi:calmodulin
MTDSVISQLSKEKLEQCKSIFNSNDINNKGSIPSKKLNFVLRSLGAYVPPDDLEEFIGNKKEIKFDKFISFFAEYYTKKIDKNQIIKGLSFLDRNNNGLISANELKHALTKLGEKISEEEGYDLLKNYTDKNGMIDYKKFTEDILK